MLLLLMMGMMLVNCFLFWSTQLNLNIDKSKVTMDSTPKLVSSQPVTQWGGEGITKYSRTVLVRKQQIRVGAVLHLFVVVQ